MNTEVKVRDDRRGEERRGETQLETNAVRRLWATLMPDRYVQLRDQMVVIAR